MPKNSPDLYTYMSQYAHTQHLFLDGTNSLVPHGQGWRIKFFGWIYQVGREHELVDSMRQELQKHRGTSKRGCTFGKNGTIIQQHLGWKLRAMMRTCIADEALLTKHVCPTSNIKMQTMTFYNCGNLAFTTLTVYLFWEVHT